MTVLYYFSSAHNLQEIHLMQLPAEHVTCGIFQIFCTGESALVTGLQMNKNVHFS